MDVGCAADERPGAAMAIDGGIGTNPREVDVADVEEFSRGELGGI